METLSPKTSPTLSISPPLTPFNIAVPNTFALPPLKTLPTWNRQQFKGDKFSRSVVKNPNLQVELIGRIDKIERCTQTSVSPLDSGRSVKSLMCSDDSMERLRKSFDKNIFFLESNQKEVLSNLHKELEKLKSQNKALKFQLVMAGDGVPQIYPTDTLNGNDNDYREDCHPWKLVDTHSEHKDPKALERKILQEEIKQLKKLLQEADAKNMYLTKLVEQLKQKASALRLHSGRHKTKSHKSDCPASGKKDMHLRQVSAKNAEKQVKQETNKFEHDSNTIQGLKQLTTNQQNELLFLKEKLQEHMRKQNMDSGVMFPRLQPTNRSVLVHANSTNVDGNCRRLREPISLPSLNGFPANRNMTLRQKRAQALHVQRQRSNRDVTLTAATK